MEKSKNKALRALLSFLMYCASGMLCALPLLIPSLWIIGWAAPAPVLFCELCQKREKDSYVCAYLRGMSFFWFFGVVVFYWFSELYPLDFLGFTTSEALITVILATCGIPLLQAIVPAFGFVFICFVRKRSFCKFHPVLSSLLFASLFVLGEFSNTLTWAGVPWGKMAVGQVGFLPIVQSASLFGSYFITFIMIFAASLLALSVSSATKKERKRAIIFASAALMVFLSNLVFGAVRMALPERSEDKITVAALQGNIRFEDKWADKEGHTMAVYERLSKEASDKGADLILWPETAIPYDYSYNWRMSVFYDDLAPYTDSEIIVTSFESEGDKLYNTARLLYSDGTVSDTVYKKRHLVPFGEYTPLEELIAAVFPPLAEMSAIEVPLSPGEGTEIMETAGGRVGCLICFDSIYETLSLESVADGAELLCISTNDSWFSGSSALRQHNAQAQLRAIENNRYIVRSANTGISSIISPKGEIIDSVGDSKEGYAIGDVAYIQERTLYSLTGNMIVWLSLSFIAFTCVLAFIENKKRDKK